MEVPQEIQNAIIGELLTREKYRFANPGIVGEVARDVFEQIENSKP